MSEETPPVTPAKPKRRFGCLHVLAIILAAVLLSVFATAWWVKRNVYASPFKTTELNEREQTEFDQKIAQLEAAGGAAPPVTNPNVAQPEAYSEDDAKREIRITEKELNAVIDTNPEWADRVAIDIAEDLLSVVLLVPVPPDFPIAGGTTARITAGATLRFENDKPVVIIRGISIGGIPLPSAWMGDLKNKDLIEVYGGHGGFWDGLARGVEAIKLEEGNLYLKLRE